MRAGWAAVCLALCLCGPVAADNGGAPKDLADKLEDAVEQQSVQPPIQIYYNKEAQAEAWSHPEVSNGELQRMTWVLLGLNGVAAAGLWKWRRSA